MEGMDQGNPAAIFDEGLFAPTATHTPARDGLGSKTYVGREGFTEWIRVWTEEFLDWRIRPVKIVDAGDDRVVTVVLQSAKGKGSGVAVELQFGVVHMLEGGQIIDHRNYIHLAEAFEAVGLSEQDAHADS